MEITAIDHIVLRTARMQAMIEFYCGVLGCRVERETDPEMGLVQLRAGDALIDLVDVNSRLGRAGGDAPARRGNNLDHFCLRIRPMEESAIRAHLARHGVEAGAFDERYGAEGFGRSVYIEDPDGNVIELRSELQKRPV